MFTFDDLKKTMFYREVREETLLEMILRLLSRRIGTVKPKLKERIQQLSITQLEDLTEALLDFSTEADLVSWLENK